MESLGHTGDGGDEVEPDGQGGRSDAHDGDDGHLAADTPDDTDVADTDVTDADDAGDGSQVDDADDGRSADDGHDPARHRRRTRRPPPAVRPRYPEETLVDPPVIRVEPPAGDGDESTG